MTFNEDVQINKEKLKRCPECGHFFACVTDGECWCHDYEVGQKNRKLLLQKYDDCICPDCLKKYADYAPPKHAKQ